MISTLDDHRDGIATAIKRIQAEALANLSDVSPWSDDLLGRLTAFSTSGKLIRGSLVVATAELFDCEPNADLYRIAAAIELVQSFLLVHDDIMDQDPVRRGMKAVYEQYRLMGADAEYSAPARFGESMGICGGDVAMLLATSALATLAAEPQTTLRITRIVSSEISKVGVAQMADVANGHRPTPATEEEILNVYRYKTGRYTFSLPLMLGAIYAGQPDAVVDALSTWGEIVGIVFQIRDDHLGIMGDTDEIGKPAGTDVSSDKQTLHRLEFLRRATGTEYEPLVAFFGRAPLGRDDLAQIREAMISLGVVDALDARIAALRAEASSVLDGLKLSDHQRAAFDAIDSFNASRTV